MNSVAELPEGVTTQGLQSLWEEDKCLEEAMPHVIFK